MAADRDLPGSATWTVIAAALVSNATDSVTGQKLVLKVKVVVELLARPLMLTLAMVIVASSLAAPSVLDSVNRPAGLSPMADWIAPPEPTIDRLPLFRKEFAVERLPAKAILRIVGLGDYDARINGQRLSDTGMNQPWSQYERTLYYRDFDITGQIKSGNNCVGVMLTNSFWDNHQPPVGRYYKQGPQRTADEPLLLAAEITLEHEDGSVERVATDASWQVGRGPVTFSHIFAGEDYDVRLEQIGWDRPGYDARAWQSARIATPPAAALRPQDWPAVEAFECFQPDSVHEPADGVFLYSFSQNCAAQLRVRVVGGEPGDRVTFRCGEHKNRDGRLFGHYVVESSLTSNGGDFTHQWLLPSTWGSSMSKPTARRSRRPSQSKKPARDRVDGARPRADRPARGGKILLVERTVQWHASHHRLGDAIEHEPCGADRLSAP